MVPSPFVKQSFHFIIHPHASIKHIPEIIPESHFEKKNKTVSRNRHNFPHPIIPKSGNGAPAINALSSRCKHYVTDYTHRPFPAHSLGILVLIPPSPIKKLPYQFVITEFFSHDQLA
jgi:hypothetical protein